MWKIYAANINYNRDNNFTCRIALALDNKTADWKTSG